MRLTLVTWSLVAILLNPTDVHSFGLRTHLMVADELVAEVETDCSFEILGENYDIESGLCAAIVNNSSAFRSGALGPDIYPDLIVGQTTTHPGIPGGWQTDDWLKHLITLAEAEREKAFAHGVLAHAASDMFAHTYVNLYSGDIFELADERAVERRHFTLEKYIDSATVVEPSSIESLTVPADFLRDALLFNDLASDQYEKAGTGLHLASMHTARETVIELGRLLEDLESFVGEALAELIAESIAASGKLALGESQLELVRETLRLQEQFLDAKQKVLEEARGSLEKLLSEIEENERAIVSLGTLADEQRKLSSESRRAAENAAKGIADARRTLTSLERDIQNVPSKITKEVCRDKTVKGACWVACPFCGKACENTVKTVCEVVEVANKVYSDLADEIQRAKNSQVELEEKVATETARAVELLALADANLKKRVARESARATLRASREAATIAFNVAEADVNAQRSIAERSREEVSKIEREIEKLRKEVIDKEEIKSLVSEILDEINILSFFTKNWIEGMDRAGSEYIRTSLAASKRLLSGQTGLLSLYQDWLSCHGNAFLAVPYQAADLACDTRTELERAESRVDRLIGKLLPPPLSDLKEDLEELKRKFREEVKESVRLAGLELIKFLTDPTTSDFLDLISSPENAT